MRALTFALAFTAASLAAAVVHAQGPGSSAWRRDNMRMLVQVDANLRYGDGCQAAVAAGGGAPPGARVDPEAIPVTVVVGPDPAGCSGKPVVRRRFAVGGGFQSLVQIFFVTAEGRLLKAEKVAIGSR